MWPKKRRRLERTASDTNGCWVLDRTSLLVMRSVQCIFRMRRRHRWSRASTVFAVVAVTAQVSAPYRKIGRMLVESGLLPLPKNPTPLSAFGPSVLPPPMKTSGHALAVIDWLVEIYAFGPKRIVRMLCLVLWHWCIVGWQEERQAC